MSDAETAQRDARLAWTIGGSLLVASGAAVLMAHTSYGFFGWLAIAGDIAWFLALLVFAFGVRGSGSVVAAQVPGVIALLVAGAVSAACLRCCGGWCLPRPCRPGSR